MHLIALIAGLICCLAVALDAFQTIILPRRPAGRLRITRLFFILTWTPWRALAPRIGNMKAREQAYSVYGPLSLLLLLVVVGAAAAGGVCAVLLCDGVAVCGCDARAEATWLATLRHRSVCERDDAVYAGAGRCGSAALAARALIICESGVGLGLVALVIGYVPVLYQAFSRREVSVALLDARAGSPPTSTELLRRHAFEGGEEALTVLLAEWERWSAEILESHISYPILCYYRSQHDNQSWLSALVAVLDSCALLISIMEGTPARQAQLTFAMARHALIDLGHVFHLEGKAKEAEAQDRLPAVEFARLCEVLGDIGMRMCGDPASASRLRAIRVLYEPHAIALSEYLRMPLPTWIPEPTAKDQWRTIARLRSEAEAVLSGGVVSEHASAVRLHDGALSVKVARLVRLSAIAGQE